MLDLGLRNQWTFPEATTGFEMMSEEQSQKFHTDNVSLPPSLDSRELKQWWQLRNVTYKVNSCCFKIYCTYSSCSVHEMLAFFRELNSKRLDQSSGKEKESCCLVFMSSTKHEIGYYHVVVMEWWQRNAQNTVLQMLSCFFVVLLDVAVVFA